MTPTKPTNPKHNTGDVEQQVAELMVCHSHGYMCEGCPLEANVKKVVALIAAREAEAEKRLIVWAMQAEGLTEPKFVSEPLAVAHRLVERMAQLDPDFAKQLNQGKRS